MMWAAPPLFSMTTGWPHNSESFAPTARATTSVTPPAAAVTYMVTGLVGKVWASAAVAASNPPSSPSIAFHMRIVRLAFSDLLRAENAQLSKVRASRAGMRRGGAPSAYMRSGRCRARGAAALAQPGALEARRIEHRERDARRRADDERDRGDQKKHRHRQLERDQLAAEDRAEDRTETADAERPA